MKFVYDLSKKYLYKFFGKIEYLLENNITMGRQIILSENEKLNIQKMYGMINEQDSKLPRTTKVDGPYNDKHGLWQKTSFYPKDQLYVVKLDSDACRYKEHGPDVVFENEPNPGSKEISLDRLVNPINGKCPEHSHFLPGNRYYVSSKFGDVLGLGRVGDGQVHQHTYKLATNGGEGYSSAKEAKDAIAELMNPEGLKGRQVQVRTGDDGNQAKQVDKYNRKGVYKGTKEKLKDASGKVIGKRQSKSGL